LEGEIGLEFTMFISTSKLLLDIIFAGIIVDFAAEVVDKLELTGIEFPL